MRITQGTFSFLPELTDGQIKKQIKYCLDKGFAVSIEYTDDPHPRNTYWEMWGMPMFDLKDPAGVMLEIDACREANSNHYIRVGAFDSNRGTESLRLSFIVNRPPEEAGFYIERTETNGRSIRYTTHSYAKQKLTEEIYK